MPRARARRRRHGAADAGRVPARRDGARRRRIGWLAIAVLGAGGMARCCSSPAARRALFDGAFVVDGFARFMKVLHARCRRRRAVLVVRLHARRCESLKFEYPVLVLLATAGMMLMISANDLIALYLGLELQSLALYVVAGHPARRRALQRGRPQILRAGRAVLRHAALRRLADLRLHRLDRLRRRSPRPRQPARRQDIGLIIGLVFLLVGLAFKISAVPFHMWTPDVYEGAPTPVTAFFAAAPEGGGWRSSCA